MLGFFFCVEESFRFYPCTIPCDNNLHETGNLTFQSTSLANWDYAWSFSLSNSLVTLIAFPFISSFQSSLLILIPMALFLESRVHSVSLICRLWTYSKFPFQWCSLCLLGVYLYWWASRIFVSFQVAPHFSSSSRNLVWASVHMWHTRTISYNFFAPFLPPSCWLRHLGNYRARSLRSSFRVGPPARVPLLIRNQTSLRFGVIKLHWQGWESFQKRLHSNHMD